MAFFTATRVFSALIFGAVIVPVIASAAPVSDTQVALVSTRGVDMTKPADQAMMRHRIAVAAHKVCDQVTEGDALTSPGYAECVGHATADASAQIGTTRAMVASLAE
jgi:UrcA family protein